MLRQIISQCVLGTIFVCSLIDNKLVSKGGLVMTNNLKKCVYSFKQSYFFSKDTKAGELYNICTKIIDILKENGINEVDLDDE